MNAAAKVFFSSPRFAVAGASSDPTKFGHKIFAWYLDHSLAVTPLNPTKNTITVGPKDYKTTPSPSTLPHAAETSLSIITPPSVTKTLLHEAQTAGVRAVFLQPGSFDDAVLDEAKRLFPGAAVGGFEGDTVGGEGWCVLVDGEAGLRSARKREGRL